MEERLAAPDEAEQRWKIGNQAIRHGSARRYNEAVIAAWMRPAPYKGMRHV